MTTEAVLLLCLFAFLTGPVFFGDSGPIRVFKNSGPKLGARLERQLATGRDFNVHGGTMSWKEPSNSPAPDGKLQ